MNPTLITCQLLGVYHLRAAEKRWQYDLEAGLPLIYFDQFEGRYTDLDPIIDDPYAGFLIGGSLLISRRFDHSRLGFRLGAGWWQEHQRDSGWTGNRIMPLASLVWVLR